jgi:hypothetical protein
VAAVVRGFHDDYQPELFEPHKKTLEPDRTFGYQVDGRWIATCSAYSRGMSVPGGAVPTAAVTVVTVSQSYRRRGLLTAMMKHQLADIHRRSEPVALLWASESLIYGRYGYGHAAPRLSISGRTRSAGFFAGVDLGQGSVGGSTVTSSWRRSGRCTPTVSATHGALDRDDGRWTITLYDPDAWRHGAPACASC